MYNIYVCVCERERERGRDYTNIFPLQNSLEGEVINPEFVVFNDTGQRFELLMKVSFPGCLNNVISCMLPHTTRTCDNIFVHVHVGGGRGSLCRLCQVRGPEDWPLQADHHLPQW